MARLAGWSPERFLTSASWCAADDVAAAVLGVAERREKLADPESRVAASEARHRQSVAIPTGSALEAVLRYEPHLSRQL